ncbi:hypothetical protein [Pseudodesulfovibrio sediminis]|uniref:Uncharacterized protein n=1 Tax=Pseudodesulfovibrio sediminis TaxID=2810563 RepID=A0ABN6EQE6_9BACT|nr:hypothetical protein [Pseudodesulfovibrio sediminis]BCS88647.1 hypothetical protein PSDVSF_18890 [Pseudodesulfovibrio sediminis]
MNVSMDLFTSSMGLVRQTTTDRVSNEGSDRTFRSIAEREEEKKQQEQSAGLPFPGQESQEDRSRIESLKSQAQQIASQADGELSSGQKSQLKAIQQEIGKISGMPMTENLVESAKKEAEQRKIELDTEQDVYAQSLSQDMEQLFGDSAQMNMAGNPGLQMLQQNALVTSIKSAGSTGLSGVKSRV